MREPPIARAHVEHARGGEPIRAKPFRERLDLERGVEQITAHAPPVDLERDRAERAVLVEPIEQPERAVPRDVVGGERVGGLGCAAPLIEILAVAAEITADRPGPRGADPTSPTALWPGGRGSAARAR